MTEKNTARNAGDDPSTDPSQATQPGAASGERSDPVDRAIADEGDDDSATSLFDAREVHEAFNEAAPPRTLSAEWQATLAAVAASDYKWLKLIFIEMPHIVRAILSFPKTAFSAALRLVLIGVRVFISSKTGAVVAPADEAVPVATANASIEGARETASPQPARDRAASPESPPPAAESPTQSRVILEPPDYLSDSPDPGAGS